MPVGLDGETVEQAAKMNAEPLGIVISRGARDEPTPIFRAYEWSAAPAGAAPRETKRPA